MQPAWSWKHKIVWLGIFAISMAVLEAAIVVHLRQLYYPEDILCIFPVQPFLARDFLIELGREAATVFMILAVAILTEKKKVMRVFACFVFLFGLWDIFYYIWLKAFINWPVSWLEWDILFLIPWVWTGPWIYPALIALAFVIWGAWIVISDKDFRFGVLHLSLFTSGCVLELTTFLMPGIKVILNHGIRGYTFLMPGDFWWWMFIPGYLIMCAGLAGTVLNKKVV
ncbi:MAG: hypothetical protein JXB88_23250 [Spirochaetales bacterium]|nr:hypothetical protein [Spirochaetales bacterium]